jgi:acyl-CoA synthetase (AMP-forming)/AMP-acid ligase II
MKNGGERPLLIVVPKEGRKPTKEDLLDHLSTEFSKWQLPDDIVFVEEIPLTATGKFSKLHLRKQFEGYFD